MMNFTTRSVVALSLLALSASAFLVVPQAPRCLNRIVSASSSVLSSEADATNIEEKIESPVIAIEAPIAEKIEQSATVGEEKINDRKVERERNTIFVGNLPFETSNQQIKELFEKYGKVDLVAIPKNKETDQPRGFAFVDMSTTEEMEAAIEGIDGFSFGSRNLRAMASQKQDENGEKPARKERKPSNKQDEDNAKKIYVGNLKFDTTKDELTELFGLYGAVTEVYIPFNAQTGQGRGFAFVSMTEEESEKAIVETNGIEFQGRKLVVNRPLAPGEKTPVRGDRGGNSRGGDRNDKRTKLYIGNLSFYTVGETLKEIFEEFGQVYDCYLPEDPETGGTRGFGFVTMSTEDSQNAIKELDGCEVDGRVIRVNEAKAKESKGRSNDEY